MKLSKAVKAWMLVFAVLIPLVIAQSILTDVHFNIPSVVAFTVTLPGEASVPSNSTGATTTDIEYNSTNGTQTNIDARVVGGAAQTAVTPIFSYDNVGTLDVNITMRFNATLPSCINVTAGKNASNANFDDSSSTPINSSEEAVVNTTITPSDTAFDWYMKAHFVGCTLADSTIRQLAHNGTQA